MWAIEGVSKSQRNRGNRQTEVGKRYAFYRERSAALKTWKLWNTLPYNFNGIALISRCSQWALPHLTSYSWFNELFPIWLPILGVILAFHYMHVCYFLHAIIGFCLFPKLSHFSHLQDFTYVERYAFSLASILSHLIMKLT